MFHLKMNRNDLKVIGVLALPVMVETILQTFLGTVDTFFAGQIDLVRIFFKKELTEKQSVNLGRLSVIIIAVIALFMALVPNSTVMGLVSYAWGGFGAAFGPLVLFGLYSKKTSWKAALSGMIVGTLTVIIWKQTGLGNTLYEIDPGQSHLLRHCQ